MICLTELEIVFFWPPFCNCMSDFRFFAVFYSGKYFSELGSIGLGRPILQIKNLDPSLSSVPCWIFVVLNSIYAAGCM